MNNQWTLSQFVTYLLLTLVFLSSWTDINGIFAELPQIVLTQPERWKLGAHLALITNLGNIAPLSLVLIKCICRQRSLNPVPINYIVILIGMLSCLLLVFFWSYTKKIHYEEHSIALLILALFLSLLDCTSSVSFADYIQRFRKEFISALFLGESLTSIIPSLLAIAQGNGQLYCVQSANMTNVTEPVYETARFSVSIYFLCLFFLLTISFVSFVLLQWTSIARNTRQVVPKRSIEPNENNLETTDDLYEQQNSSKLSIQTPSSTITKPVYILLCVICTYTSSILFGMLLSIATYVLMPYGHRIFYLGTILSPWMFTLVWLLGMIKPLLAKRYLFVLLTFGTVTFCFIMIIAFRSPCPPLVNTTKGNILVLVIWLSTYVLLGYPRLIIANYVRIYSPDGMFWFGVNVQLGALIGSIVAYLLVETFGLFQERLPCVEMNC